jgi:hypothetical protein
MKETPISTFLLIITIFIFGCASMVAWQRDSLKREAVERGFAEWTTDSSGNSTWRWKEVK